jgi:hypothetical protein
MPGDLIGTRFPDPERYQLAALEAAWRESQQGVIRRLVRTAAGLLERSPEAALIDHLMQTWGAGSVLTFRVEGSPTGGMTVVGHVDAKPGGYPGDAPNAPFHEQCRVVARTDEPGRITVELVPIDDEPTEAGARVFVAVLPLRASARVTIKLSDLHPAGT